MLPFHVSILHLYLFNGFWNILATLYYFQLLLMWVTSYFWLLFKILLLFFYLLVRSYTSKNIPLICSFIRDDLTRNRLFWFFTFLRRLLFRQFCPFKTYLLALFLLLILLLFIFVFVCLWLFLFAFSDVYPTLFLTLLIFWFHFASSSLLLDSVVKLLLIYFIISSMEL